MGILLIKNEKRMYAPRKTSSKWSSTQEFREETAPCGPEKSEKGL